MKLCVTGGRTYAERAVLFEVLDVTHELWPIDALAHGACPTGADALADAWCIARCVECVRFPANWRRYGGRRAAGPIRNRHMLGTFKPDVVIAFPGGTGTADCVSLARHAFGIAVLDLRERLRVSNKT